MANRDSKVMPKLQWHLVPFDVLPEVVEVLMGEVLEDGTKTGGKAKYGANNWRTPPYFKPEDVVDSLVRHLVARFFNGEEFDLISGKRHTAHIITNALFLQYYDQHDLWDYDGSEILINGEAGADIDTVGVPGTPMEKADVLGVEETNTNETTATSTTDVVGVDLAKEVAKLSPENLRQLRARLAEKYGAQALALLPPTEVVTPYEMAIPPVPIPVWSEDHE